MNDFILTALRISADKRKLPFYIVCPNDSLVYPLIKRRYEKYQSSLSGDDAVAMCVSWLY